MSRRRVGWAAGGVLMALLAATFGLRLAARDAAVTQMLVAITVLALALAALAVGAWSLYVAVAGARELAGLVREAQPIARDSREGARVWMALRAAGISEKLGSVDVLITDQSLSMAITVPGRRRKLIFGRHVVEESSPEALLGVAAHEYSHLRQPPAKLFVVAAGLVALGLAVALIGTCAVTAAASGMLLVLLAVSRRIELDADRRACVLLGSTIPVRICLEEMREAAWPRWARLLSTHPPKHERLEAVERLQQRWDERES